jgi:hypothetical protein
MVLRSSRFVLAQPANSGPSGRRSFIDFPGYRPSPIKDQGRRCEPG